MDKGAWWVTVQRVTKIGHDLATKQEICTRKPNMARQIEKTRQIPGQLCFQALALGGLAARISNFHPG